jgi:hypothetical protein
MRSWKIVALSLVLLPPGAGRAQDAAQDAARAVIEQAIKAHGGEERLSRHRADRVKFKGNLFVNEKVPAPFVAELTVQLPSQFKMVMETNPGGDKHTIVQILNGDKVTTMVDGKVEKTDPAALAELRDMQESDRAVRLVPLLHDRTYELALLEDTKVNDRPAATVRVLGRGRKEFRLYFDRELGLLVKFEHLLDDGSGKQVRHERYFGDFKDVGGYKRPFKVIAFRDQRKLMEADILDVKYYDKIDDSEFTKP